MAQTNVDILKGYYEEVVNQKKLDLLPKYFSEKSIMHGMPYVGMGIMPDTSSGNKVIVRKVNPNSPAGGKLMEGDEILRAKDDGHSWSTFEELRNGGLWGQGVIGTPITIFVRRGNEEKEIQITRGLVKGFEFTNDLHKPGMQEFFKDWPDVKARLVNVLEAGDMLAFHAEFEGRNVRYGRSAVWSEFGFVRFKDGKIMDWWNSDEEVSTLRQLGFSIREPEMVKA